MTVRRASLWVGVLATLAYANSVPNGLAYDDTAIVAQNEVVTESMVLEAWTRPYWPLHSENSGLYRPVTVSSFAAEWRVFGPNPAGYHAVNVIAHVGVSLLVLALLVAWTPVTTAAPGATAFAVHPLHTEAVANIVGRGELYAAGFALALSPANYALLIEVGNFHGEHGAWEEAEGLLRSAIVLSPERPAAARALAHQLIQRQRYRDAHRVALDGLKAVGADRELFVHMSETYVAAAHTRAQARWVAVDRQGPVGSTPTGRIVRLTQPVQGSGT